MARPAAASLPQFGPTGRLVILLVGGLVALGVGANAIRHEREMREDRLRVELASVASRVGSDLTAAAQHVRSARAYLAGSELVTPLEFAAFFADLAPVGSVPWRALAAAVVAPPGEPPPWPAYLDRHAGEYAELGYPTDTDFDAAPADHVRAPVVLVEPTASRPEGFGYDMATEPGRRETVRRAAASGRIEVSPALVLPQDRPDGPESLLLIASFPAAALGASPRAEGFVALSITPSVLLARAAEAADATNARYRAVVRDPEGRALLSVRSDALEREGFEPAGFRVVRPEAVDVPVAEHVVRLEWQPGGDQAVVPFTAGVPVGSAILLVSVLTAILLWRIETEQTRLEDQLARQERELRASEEVVARSQRREALGRLTGGVAHDFNNLLSVVIGSLDLLGRRLGSDPEAERLRRNALEAADRGARLTQRLLTLGRQATLQPEVFDVAELIDSSRVILRASVPEDIDLRIRPSGASTHVRADRTQFEAALLNLVINARDAMADGGTLTVSERRVTLPAGVDDDPDLPPGDYAVLCVEDTGHGMSEEVLAAALDPFFTTKEAGAGSGLGLSTVLGFARQSGGDLVIESSEGVGTRVRIFLPAAEDHAPPADAHADADDAPIPSVHVLIVEDESAVRGVIRRQLEESGYVVTTADSGDRAIEMLDDSLRPDVVLSDVVMPGRNDGGAVARRARGDGIPVILMSGYPRGLDDADVPSDVPLLPKPFRVEELTRTILRTLPPLDGGRAAGHGEG